MNKRDSFSCCLSFVGLGLALVCLSIVVGGGSILLAQSVNAPATPTPVTTCAGLLETIHRAPGVNHDIRVAQKTILNVYQVKGDEIFGLQKELVPENLLALQDDLESHILIWDYFVSIIPAAQRQPLTEYRIFSDGSGNKAGYTDIQWSLNNATEVETWALEVDLADYQDLASVNDTLVHEFGHMLTLNGDQIDFRTAPTNCQFYIDNRQCTFGSSYLNRFFDRFWKGELYTEWQALTSQADQAAVKSALRSFYQAHRQAFVRDYAATAPREDLADSWTYFVMLPQPAGETLAEQKILFFYTFPELVSLRSEIRRRICLYNNMPE